MPFRCIYYTMNLNDIGEHEDQSTNPLDSLIESRIQWILEMEKRDMHNHIDLSKWSGVQS